MNGSLKRLLNIAAAGMIVIPAVLIVLTGMDYLDRNVIHNTLGWVPMSIVVGAGSVWVFNKTSH